MKIASIYDGRSMSQPVLYNHLHDSIDVDLHIFKDHSDPIAQLDFSHKHSFLEVNNVTVRDQTALWATQCRLRKRWKEFLQKAIDETYDLLIGMNELATPTVDVADHYDIPSIFFLRNLGVTGQEMYQNDRCLISNFRHADRGAKLQFPFFVHNFKEYKRGMRNADAVVANSEYVQERLRSDFSVKAEVIYPPIKPEDFEVEYDENGYIGMVNPRNTEKGGDIFLDVVESMPSEQFLASGVFRDSELEERCDQLDNLTHIGWCDDMREFYKQTRLLIVPTRVEEAFGRVAAEAMVSGIPCVVSNRGGLPEVVGDTGVIVDNIESVEAWKEAFKTAIENHDPDAQIKRAKKFSAERQTEKLIKIIEAMR